MDLVDTNFFPPLEHHKGVVHGNANNLINAKSLELIGEVLVTRNVPIGAGG